MIEQCYFLKDSQFEESVEQGINRWINYPDPVTTGFITARVVIHPQIGHDFHCRPVREELSVAVEQCIEESHQILSEGDAVEIPEGLPHASFNIDQTSAELFGVLTPAQIESVLSEDVSSISPWNALLPANLP